MNHTPTHPGVAEWNRRRRASERMAPIDDTGNVDPWLRTIPAPLTPRQIEGAVAAAEHLLREGLPPLFDPDVIRALWRHGNQQLACHLWGTYAEREKAA